MMSQPEGDAPASAAFDAMFAANYADVFKYAVRRCASVEDAEDLVADTFLVAWRRMAELPPGTEARLWLFGTARLLLHNQRRSTGRQRRLFARLRSRDRRPPPEDLASRLAARSEVGHALVALPEADREILLLAGWEDLSSEDVAEVLGITPATARKRFERARQRLRAHLEPPSTATTAQLLPEEA